MGWTLHYYSDLIENYGSELAPSDTVDDFPGIGAVYLRLPWAFLEPEEGKFTWETFDTPAQRWIDNGQQVCLRVTAMESWMYHATPRWVFEAGAKGYDVNGVIFEPEYEDPVFLEKVENFAEERVYPADRAVLYLALAEIKYVDDVPPVVSVSEAAALARKFSTEKSADFVNGVLGGVINAAD